MFTFKTSQAIPKESFIEIEFPSTNPFNLAEEGGPVTCSSFDVSGFLIPGVLHCVLNSNAVIITGFNKDFKAD